MNKVTGSSNLENFTNMNQIQNQEVFKLIIQSLVQQLINHENKSVIEFYYSN